MNALNYHSATFLKSAAKISQLPEGVNKEVAFIGRSNVGKSSALNALTGQKHLARTSKTPGRTQCVNFFSIDNKNYLVDLPGYGYAKVPKTLKDNWHQLLDQYLRTGQNLQGLILLMDIRHPLQEFEKRMLDWATQMKTPTHVLLTKADKLSRGAQSSTLQTVQNILKEQEITVSIFSAKQKLGLKELEERLNTWFE